MAALVDSDIGVELTPGTSVESASLTVSGSNTYLLAAVLSSEGTPLTPSAVKWGGSGGTSMSHISSTLNVGSFEKLDLYELIAPSASTTTVHVTWGSSQDEKLVIAMSFSGVDQSTPTRTIATATGNSTAPAAAATSVSGDLVIGVAGFLDLTAASLTITSGNTAIQEIEGPTLTYHGFGSSSATASTSSTNMTWTISGGIAKDWGAFAMALIDATGAAPYVRPPNASMFVARGVARGNF